MPRVIRPILRRLVVVAVTLLVLLLPASAAAFPLDNCTAEVTSFDADGNVLGTVRSGADDATQTDPLIVHWDGTIGWAGSSGSTVFGSHTWGVTVFGIPTTLQGADTNDSGDTEADGTVTVADNVPIEIVGLFLVSGQISDTDGNSCKGEGWLLLDGDPLGSLQFWLGLLLLLLGLLMWFMARRGNFFWGILGGLLVGAGATILMITFAFVPAGNLTPWINLGVALLVGLAIPLFGRRSSRPATA